MSGAASLALALLLAQANPAIAQKELPPSKPHDPLAAPIRVAINGLPVSQALKELQAQSGARLGATAETRDQRVAIFVHGRPLSVAFSGIAKLLNYRWTRQGELPATRYILGQDLHARRDEQERLRRLLEARVAPWLEAAARSRARALNKLAPPAQARLLTRTGVSAQIDYLLRNSGRVPAPGLQLISSLTVRQREQLLLNGLFYLRWKGMDLRQQVLAELYLKEQEIDSAERLQLLRRIGPLFYASADPGDPGKVRLTLWFDGSFRSLAPEGAGPPWGRSEKDDHRPVRVRPYPAPRGVPAPSYAAVERLPTPKELRFDPKRTYTWPQALEVVSQNLPLALFADHFRASADIQPRSGAVFNQLSRGNLAEFLDALCRQHRRVWWVEGSSIFLRDRDWCYRRLYEAPVELEQALGARLAEHGALDSEGIALVSQLTPRQLEGWGMATALEGGARTAPSPGFWAQKAQPYLTLLGALTPAQRLQALSPEGLPLEQMTPAQRESYLQTLLITEGAEVMRDYSSISLRVNQSRPRVLVPGKVSALAVFFTYAPEARMLAMFSLPYCLGQGETPVRK